MSRRPGFLGRLVRSAARSVWPNQRLRWTWEGFGYAIVWAALMGSGLHLQVNLLLLVAGMAAGPLVASIFVSASMLRRLRVTRRVPPYVFSGDPLAIDYTLRNDRRFTAALALFLEDEMTPVDRAASGSEGLSPRLFFERVPARDGERLRWQGQSPRRGKYKFRDLDLATRSPFGLLERRVTISEPEELTVYPTIGRLSRRWQLIQREALESRRGRRHDLSSLQQEYHGLRMYRPGDSPRWIHWRTSARLGQLMVKEFEQQNEQDLAILIDPWLPRNRVSNEQRESLELAIRFAATLCLETCRTHGRRVVLGWTGPTPGLRQGPSSVKLLHELLEQLAILRPAPEGSIASLLDALPPAILRESILILVTNRQVNLFEEAEKTSRLAGGAARGLMGRVVLLDASRGDLDDLVQFVHAAPAETLTRRDLPSGERDPEDVSLSRETRRGTGRGSASGSNARDGLAINGKSDGLPHGVRSGLAARQPGVEPDARGDGNGKERRP